MGYLEKCRDEHAARADRLAENYLSNYQHMSAWERGAHLASMRLAGQQRDAYARQVDWHNRATATAWPATPAWTD